jgi:CheY-like chemotaxis protein
MEEDSVASDTLAGVKVLVAEDQPQMLEIIERALSEHGASVVAVGGGAEALALLTAPSGSAFDVLVSDIGMPQVDGYALIRAVRSELMLSPAQLPAVAVTAFARPEDRTRLVEAGFQAHLSKPYQVVQLVSTVRTLARARRGGVSRRPPAPLPERAASSPRP